MPLSPSIILVAYTWSICQSWLWRNLGVTFTGAVNAILDKLEAHYNLGDHDDAILGLFATHLRRLLSIFEELGE